MIASFVQHPMTRITFFMYLSVVIIGVVTQGSNSLLISQGLIAAGCGLALRVESGSRFDTQFPRPRSVWGITSILVYLSVTAWLVAVNEGSWTVLLGSMGQIFGGAHSFAVFVMAPVFEEIYFRGFLLGALLHSLKRDKNDGVLWAIYLQALIFFLFHIPVDPDVWAMAWAQGGVPINVGPFFLGLWCGVIVWKDGSIWLAILAHAIANLLTAPWSWALSGHL